MSYDWLTLEAACNGLEVPPRTTLFTVNGTGVADPFGPGFPGDVARAVGDEKYLWQPIGYPADVFPMRRSINQGRAELVRQINRYPGKFVMSGYSQGGAVTSLVWRDDILNKGGVLHHRLDDVVAIVNYGDPLRCFPAGTLVRKADGTECPIESIEVGDQVVTAEANVGRVIATTEKYAESLVELHIEGHRHLRTTLEHQILTQRGYIAAGDLEPGDMIAFPKYAGEHVTYISPNYHAGKPKANKPNYVALPERLDLTPEFGRVIGLFLAEGSTQVGNSGMTIWDFCEDEADTLAAEVVSFLRKFGLSPTVVMTPEKRGCRVYFCGVGWARMFRSLCGHLANGKRLHADLANGPKDFLEAVLSGWLDGDGHVRRGSATGTTVSHSLALSMYDIAQALGRRPIISTRHREPNQRCWEVAVSVRERNQHDTDAYEKRWMNSRNTSGVVGVSYRKSYPGTSKWRACHQGVELGQHATKEDAAKAVRLHREELARRGALVDNRGRTRSAQDDTHVWRRFIELEEVAHEGSVYDFTVEGDHSYVAEGVGVHNCPGVANGNRLAGQPVPKKLNGHVTGGIAGPDCLKPEETPDFFYSFANDGDLYASAPVGDDPWNSPTKVGSYQTLVYELVMDFTGGDILDFAVAAAEIMAQPLTTVLPLVQAIWGGLAFAVQGPRAPHWTYDVRPAVELLRSL